MVFVDILGGLEIREARRIEYQVLMMHVLFGAISDGIPANIGKLSASVSETLRQVAGDQVEDISVFPSRKETGWKGGSDFGDGVILGASLFGTLDHFGRRRSVDCFTLDPRRGQFRYRAKSAVIALSTLTAIEDHRRKNGEGGPFKIPTFCLGRIHFADREKRTIEMLDLRELARTEQWDRFSPGLAEYLTRP